MKVYRQGTVQVLPKLQKLLGSSNNQEIAYNAVQLKEAIVKVLLDNVVSNEDLAVVLDFAKDAVLVAAPLVSGLVTDNEMLANVIAQVVEVMESIDSLEVAGAITDLYKAFLNSLDYITEDLVANGHEVALAELKEMDAMGEVEENIVMLQSLLKVSRILARRVEKKSKNWYKY